MKTQPTKTVLKASRQEGEIPNVFCNSVGEYLKELFSIMEEAEKAREKHSNRRKFTVMLVFGSTQKEETCSISKVWHESGI